MNSTIAKTAVSSIVLALAALGSASSFASDSTVKNSAGELLFPHFTSTMTQAQVQAEYFKALKAGQIVPSIEGTTLKAPAFASSRSPAEVRMEAVMSVAHPPRNMGSV